MAEMNILATAQMVCKSAKCQRRITRQNLMEVIVKGKPSTKDWICTECLTKTPAPLPDAAPAV